MLRTRAVGPDTKKSPSEGFLARFSLLLFPFLFLASFQLFSPASFCASQTELGSAGDLSILGTGGTALDPDTKIKGFTVFGATQAAYAGAVVGDGNVVVNGVLSVSSGAYFVANATFPAAGNIFINDGSAGQVLSKNGSGYLQWTSGSALGDNLGNHIATTTLNMASFNIVNVSSVNFKSNVYLTTATAAQYGGVYVSTNIYTGANVYANNITANEFYGDGSGLTGVSARNYISVPVPAAVNDYMEIGNYNISNGAHNLYIAVTVSDAGFIVAKQYAMPLNYNLTSGLWRDAIPASNTGAYGGNDFALEVKVTNATAYLRIRRTSGASSGTALVSMEQIGPSADLFTQTGNSGTSASNPYLTVTALTQTGGNVGIGTMSPGSTLEVAGDVTLSGSMRTLSLGASQGIRDAGTQDITLFTSNVSPGPVILSPAGNETARFTPDMKLGIGTPTPAYRLQVSSAAGFSGTMMSISTGAVDVIRMTGAGWIYANKYYGDGSSLSGVMTSGDNLGSHIATTTLNMANFNIANANFITASSASFTNAVTASSYTATGIGVAASKLYLNPNVEISSTTAANYGGVYVSSNVFINGDIHAGKLYGDGSTLSGLGGTLSGGVAPKLPYWINGTTLGNSVLAQDAGNSLTVMGSTLTVQGTQGIYASRHLFASNVEISSETSPLLGAGVRISTNVYIVGFSSAAKYYGDASSMTGLPAGDNLGSHIATKDLNLASFNIVNVSSVNFKSNVYLTTATAAQYGGIYVSSNMYVSGMTKLSGAVDTDTQFLGQPADTVGAPSFSWTGDTNTGIYSPAADTLGFVTNGGERLRIDAAGLISGIGPITLSSFTASGIGLTAAQLRLSTANSVAISSEASAALGGGVRVSTNIYVVGFSSATKYYGDGSALTGLSGLADNLGNHTATQNLNINGFNIVNISTLSAYTSGVYVATNAFVMGNFGIGTSSPTYKLYLAAGDFRNENDIRTGNIADPGRWRFYDISGYLMSRWVPGTDYDTWGLYWDQPNHKMIWRGNGVDAASVDLDDGTGYYAGNVGIGGYPSGAKFDVMGGSATIHGLSTQANVLQAGDNGIVISTGGAITTTGVGNGTVAGNARGNGAVDLQTNRSAATQAASGQFSAIGGGYKNTASNDSAAVGGGYNNQVTAQYGAIAGGANNQATNNSAAIGGGNGNIASNQYSSVNGGMSNTASGMYSAVGGGLNNLANGSASMVPGGTANSAAGNYSFAAGFTSTSTAAGAFTWADSQGIGMNNTVQDQVLFKDRGGFMVTGSTNTNMTGTLDRGVFISGNGLVGISTGVPGAALDVVSTGSTNSDYVQIWRNKSGVIVASMTSTGYLALSGVPGDNLGNHTATQDLNLQSFGLVNVSTISGTGIWISSYGVIQTAGPGLNGIAGGVRGAGAVDLQPYRTGAAQVASGNYSVIAGGSTNTASNTNAAVLGGSGNTASGSMAVVAGGNSNMATGQGSTISGGYFNNAFGQYSMVPGGAYNTAKGSYSFAAGYRSSSTVAGAFTWTDSATTELDNNVADMTIFKNRGGFMITGSTNTNMTGTLDRGVFITGNGLVGISTGTPWAALDIVSTGTADTIYANIWRNSSGVIVASMTSTGKLFANVTAATGAGDNLGNHTATQNLNMAGFDIVSVSTISLSSVTTAASGVTFSTNVFFAKGNVGIGTNSPLNALDVAVGQVLVPAGGTNTPSVAFRNDTMTGFYRNAANVFAITAGGSGNDYYFSSTRLEPNNGGFSLYSLNGSAASPDYSFKSDHTTGLFRPANSILGFATGGIERMRIDGFGAVGIGTMTAQAALDVVSTGTAVNIYAQIWHNGSGVIVASMTSQGTLYAGLPPGSGDNLGNHTATQDLKMQGYSIVNAASGTFTQALTTYSSMTVAGALGIGSPKHYFGPNVEISSYSTAGYGAGISISTLTYTPGLVITSYGALQTTGVGTGSVTGNARGAGAVDLQVNRGGAGGAGHVASGAYSVVGGGQDNAASGANSVVPGGSANTAGNQYSAVGGGIGNNATGMYAAIPGGNTNTASGSDSFAAGYVANSAANGAFTWADSAGTPIANNTVDMTLFKDRGGFMITGSTNTVMSGTVDRGVFITGNGLVGISTGVPYAALDVVSTGTTASQYAQIWRDSGGVVKASMTANGIFYGTVANGDNLGNHTATQNLNLAQYSAVNVASITMVGDGLQIATDLTATGNGIFISTSGQIMTQGVGNGLNSPAARGQGAVDLQNYRSVSSMVSSGTYSVIAGGGNNSAGGNYSVVLGGLNNNAASLYSGVGSGQNNSATGPGSVVAGGQANSATNNLAAVVGGNLNAATGANSFVGSGLSNTASGGDSAVLGGSTNQALNAYSAVLGGYLNVAQGNSSVVAGGRSNTAVGLYSFAAGYYSSSTVSGAFTWSDSQGTENDNTIIDRTLFKNRGGFMITGSTNTNMTGTLDRGVFITGNGLVGISTGVPYAALDVVSTGTTASQYAQIWRDSGGVVKASMTANGIFYGTVANGDNLGNHTATQALNMNNYAIWSSSDITAAHYQINGSTVLAVLAGAGSLGVGIQAGAVNTGADNTFIGYQSGLANSSGYDNAFAGYGAGNNNISGYFNAAFGSLSGHANITGYDNSYLGYGAGYLNASGTDNTFIGQLAGRNTKTGSADTVLGSFAGYGVANNSFSSSTLVGYQAGYSLTTGNDNVFIGYRAGYSVTTGTGNIVIGDNQDVSGGGANNELNIGNVLFGKLDAKTIGISTRLPLAALDIVSTGTSVSQYAQVWRNSSGVVVASMTSTGNLYTTVSLGDNLGNHTATQNLSMAGYNIVNASSISVAAAAPGLTVSTNLYVMNGKIGIGTTNPAGALQVSNASAQPSDLLFVLSSGTAVSQQVFSVNANGFVYARGGVTYAGDLAELYRLNGDGGAGDVVMLAPGSGDGPSVVKASPGGTVLGIVATAPGITIGHGDIGETGRRVPVALSGRVPVKVSLENGPIRAGTMLTASDIPGRAAAAVRSGMVIGMALEDFDPAKGDTVLCFVSRQYWVAPGEFESLRSEIKALKSEIRRAR